VLTEGLEFAEEMLYPAFDNTDEIPTVMRKKS
jgi:hypothetical protein